MNQECLLLFSLLLLVPACSSNVVVSPKAMSFSKKKVAVINTGNTVEVPFKSFFLIGGTYDNAMDATPYVRNNLMASGLYEVITREHLESILEEHKLSATDMIAPNRAAEIGKLAGLDAIVFVKSERPGIWIFPFFDEWGVGSVEMIDVSTGSVMWSGVAKQHFFMIVPLFYDVFFDSGEWCADTIVNEVNSKIKLMQNDVEKQ